MFVTSQKRLPLQQITSKGCSRGYILCVLYRALDYVRQRHASGQTVQFPFCHSDIKKWLEAAQTDCSICENSYQEGLGGTPYDDRDPSTYWTQPQQFCTWWKNNVERKNKFLILQRDASYCENTDDKLITRAAYCRNAIAIALSMKNYFYRYLPKERDAKIVQYMIPYPMPRHMDITATAKPVADVPLPTNVAVITKQVDSLRQSEKGAASDIDSTPESPTMGSSVLHSPSSTLNVNVKGTWSINTSDSSIIYPHAAMNSVTPENKKRKQQQQDSRTDEEGEFFSFSRRKNTCAGSDHIKTEGCGSGTNSYLSQIDFRKDEDSCSSDSGTDEEAKKHNGQSSVKYSIIGKKQRREEELRRIDIINEEESESNRVGQILEKPKASLSPTLFLPITKTQSLSKPAATSTLNDIASSNLMRRSRSILNLSTGDGLDEGSRRLCQFSPTWSSPSSRHFPNSQFSLDRSFDDDLLDLLSKSISSNDLARHRIMNCSTDMEECLFLSMSVTPVPNSPISAFYGSPCNTPPLIGSPSRLITFDSRNPSISVRRNIPDSSEEQRALSIALANRLSELFNGEEENEDSTRYSCRSGVTSPQSDGIFNKQDGDELIGDRKVRFRELDDVRVIGTSPSSSRTTGESTPLYSTFDAVPFDLAKAFRSSQGDSSSFLDDSEICSMTRGPVTTSAVDSSTRPFNLNGDRPSYFCADRDRDRDRDRVGSNYSSMDTLDCNDLITIISIINENDASCNCKEKEKDRDMDNCTKINIDNRSHRHEDEYHECRGNEDLSQVSILTTNERVAFR